MNKNNKNNIPTHVALILDGNRRWARERNLPTLEGHLKGKDVLKQAVNWFFDRGVKILSVFAFSTENWNRSTEEVNYLMKLLKNVIEKEQEEAQKNNYRVLISGRLSELPGDLPDACLELMDKTKSNTRGIFHICLNYGGHAEIVDAVKKMIKNKISPEQVHEGMLRKYLYQSELEYPDIIVRTSGEQRLSGFLLWQSAYSELLFLKKYWPEFEESDVDKILTEYTQRKRRFGGD